MHLRRLAEIAALVATQAHHVIDGDHPVGDDVLKRYLHHYSELQRLWRNSLDAAVLSLPTANTASPDDPSGLPALMSEVLVAELLVRTWTAVLTAADAGQSPGHAGPLARHVLVSTFQMRHHVLKLVVDGGSLPLGSLVKVDRLRRRCERWCDLLLGRLASQHDVLEFAFDVRRAGEHSRSGRGEPLPGTTEWPLIAAGLQAAFPADPIAPERDEAVRELTAAVMSAFPAAAFDLDGRFYPVEVHRFQQLPWDARSLNSLHSASRSRAIPPPSENDATRQALIRFRKLFPRGE